MSGVGDAFDRSLASLAIFPLPDVVLLPGAVLPLHVFEARYRDMVRDVLAADRALGVARLRPGYEADYAGRPPVYDVVGAGIIVADDRLADGRYNILLRGMARVAVERELPPDQSYRRVRARRLDDARTARPDAVASLHEQLLSVCDRLAGAMGEQGEQLRELTAAIESPSVCADVLGAALVQDPDDRQALLETLDAADRIEMILERVTRLVARIAPNKEMLN